ncbi:hypothetical protein PIB30_081023 [Stylosanthes scabra]|uniref:Uncharacterized protein n=1 Tax=Stylosanthes scabra TaxID=79078 RepID=A0ABU6ZQC4_9FABA|nr:hypothetical protein [Stylosanthes scabra]
MLGGRAQKCAMGLQNFRAIINWINTLLTHLRKGSCDSTRNHRRNHADIPESNKRDKKMDTDLISEIREEARIKQQAVKKLLIVKHSKKIKKRNLEKGDLVLRREDIGGKNAAEGKLGGNWEEPYQMDEALRKGSYKPSTTKRMAEMALISEIREKARGKGIRVPEIRHDEYKKLGKEELRKEAVRAFIEERGTFREEADKAARKESHERSLEKAPFEKKSSKLPRKKALTPS